MARAATSGTLLVQYRVTELIEKIGVADPESAVDVLAAIRSNPKPNQEIEVPLWGRTTLDHLKVLSNIPWILFSLAAQVDEQLVAGRFLNEFREHVLLESEHAISTDVGKSPRQLLNRLLGDSRNADAFLIPAHQIVSQHLLSDCDWPFVSIIASTLLEPVQESMHWGADWTATFSRTIMRPNSDRWNTAIQIRTSLFDALEQEIPESKRTNLWRLIADSHRSMHYAMAHERMDSATTREYSAILNSDLTSCERLLRKKTTFGEATSIRPLWEWYLQYSPEPDLLSLARQCEQIYASLSQWHLQEFFRFESDEDLRPETERIAEILRTTTDSAQFNEFFGEAEQYLRIARGGKEDQADNGRIIDLANTLFNYFSSGVTDKSNALSSFVFSVLQKGGEAASLQRFFSITLCRLRLAALKRTSEEAVKEWLEHLLSMTPSKAHLLFSLYHNAHPDSTGTFTDYERHRLLECEPAFETRQLFWILGVLCGATEEDILPIVHRSLESIRADRLEAGHCLTVFIRSAYMTFRRYARIPASELIQSLFDWIIAFKLTGGILSYSDFSGLRQMSGYVPNVQHFLSFMRSRVELDNEPKPDERFEIVPFRLHVNEWCTFDSNEPQEMTAFHEFCELALRESFTSSYWIPKYLSQINPDGRHVADFVRKYVNDTQEVGVRELSRLGRLASQYPPESEAWAQIARSICSRATNLVRDERESVYFGLTNSETGVLSTRPGEVAQYYIDVRNQSQQLLNNEPLDSPLRPYREWALRRAEEVLQREQGWAEELDHE